MNTINQEAAGAVEPNAHPLFEPELSKSQILGTHYLGTRRWFAHPILNRLHRPWACKSLRV